MGKSHGHGAVRADVESVEEAGREHARLLGPPAAPRRRRLDMFPFRFADAHLEVRWHRRGGVGVTHMKRRRHAVQELVGHRGAYVRAIRLEGAGAGRRGDAADGVRVWGDREGASGAEGHGQGAEANRRTALHAPLAGAGAAEEG